MTVGQCILILLFSTFSGWFIGWMTTRFIFHPIEARKYAVFSLQGFLPYLQEKLAPLIGQYARSAVYSNSGIVELFHSPALVEKLRPEIEKHVDHFLQEKLSAAFPLLYKFMGEKTLAQFRAVFLTEIDSLFPQILKQYTVELTSSIPVDAIVAQKIKGLDMKLLEKNLLQHAGKKLAGYRWFCAMTGLLLGILLTGILLALPA
jgi:uncharacterized membrane protein YheB (UPF0754 family)